MRTLKPVAVWARPFDDLSCCGWARDRDLRMPRLHYEASEAPSLKRAKPQSRRYHGPQEDRGPLSTARIGVLSALNRNVERC